MSTQGGPKDQEASYIYEELIDKHGGSAMLLCGLAVARMHMGQFEDAEARLQDALIKVLYCVYIRLSRPCTCLTRSCAEPIRP